MGEKESNMTSQIDEMRNRYLALVARTLDGTIYEDPPLQATGSKDYDATLREYGWDWPSVAFTMVGTKRLANFRSVIESVLGEHVPGDIVETGVWRGGACIMARAVLLAYGVEDRRVIVCDSFEGLPPPDAAQFPADSGSNFHEYADLSVSLDQVKRNFAKFDLLDDRVVFLKGWFRDTMPTVPSETIAVLRLDGDMYESTFDPLRHLYGRIPDGGWIIVDDYHVVPPAKEALHDFLASQNETPQLKEIDGVGVFFRKNEERFLAARGTVGQIG
jgi:O-methyltransferase